MMLPLLPPRELAAQLRADMATILPAIHDLSYSFEERCKLRTEYVRLARVANSLVRQAILDDCRVVHRA